MYHRLQLNSFDPILRFWHASVINIVENEMPQNPLCQKIKPKLQAGQIDIISRCNLTNGGNSSTQWVILPRD